MTHDDGTLTKLRGFNAADQRVILDWVSTSQQRARAVRNKRADTRFLPPKNAVCKASIEHMGGSKVERLVFVSDISAGGLGMIHHGYVHAGAGVRVELMTIDGECMFVTGTIRWCEYLSNKLHVLGVQLSEKLNPKHFIEEQVWLNQRDDDEVQTWVRSRRALYVNDNEIETSGMEMLLKNANIECVSAGMLGSALDQVERDAFDLVIVDDRVGECTGEEVVNNLVARLYSGPIVLVSPVKSSVEDAALAAGAAAVVEKPVQLTPFLAVLRDIFEEADDPSSGSAAISTSLSEDQCSEESLNRYMERVASMAAQLNECVSMDMVDEAVRLCSSLHSTGTVYGLDALSSAAGAAVKSITASGSVQESKADVRRVIKTIGRLRRRDGQRVAA